MKKILITGGAGFLGSNLSKKLHDEGSYIYCVDNLYTGRMKNIANLIGKNNFEFINHDITNPLDLVVDEIYNLINSKLLNYKKSYKLFDDGDGATAK